MKLLVVLVLLKVALAEETGPVALSTNQIHTPKMEDAETWRKRRGLGSILSLLWPQVVGPVDQGMIVEQTYEELPKTLLEHKLDKIRKKAREEEISRLAVRAYMQNRLKEYAPGDVFRPVSNYIRSMHLFYPRTVLHGFPIPKPLWLQS